MKIATALLLAALAAGSSGKPKVEFKPMRAVTQLAVGRCEALVTFRLKVADGGSDDYYCPRVVFEWEDGTRSSEESDCAPFEEAAAADHERTWTRSRGFQKPGTYLVRAHLCKASRRIKTIDARAVIMGWDGYDPDVRQGSGCSAARSSGMGSQARDRAGVTTLETFLSPSALAERLQSKVAGARLSTSTACRLTRAVPMLPSPRG